MHLDALLDRLDLPGTRAPERRVLAALWGQSMHHVHWVDDTSASLGLAGDWMAPWLLPIARNELGELHLLDLRSAVTGHLRIVRERGVRAMVVLATDPATYLQRELAFVERVAAQAPRPDRYAADLTRWRARLPDALGQPPYDRRGVDQARTLEAWLYSRGDRSPMPCSQSREVDGDDKANLALLMEALVATPDCAFLHNSLASEHARQRAYGSFAASMLAAAECEAWTRYTVTDAELATGLDLASALAPDVLPGARILALLALQTPAGLRAALEVEQRPLPALRLVSDLGFREGYTGALIDDHLRPLLSKLGWHALLTLCDLRQGRGGLA